VDSGYGWIVDSSQYDLKTTNNRRLGADGGVVYYCLLVIGGLFVFVVLMCVAVSLVARLSCTVRESFF